MKRRMRGDRKDKITPRDARLGTLKIRRLMKNACKKGEHGLALDLVSIV